MSVLQYSLVARITQLVRRCVEHGIWSALLSSQQNFENLQKIRRTDEMPNVNHEQELFFEYWLLSFGLAMAILVFGAELVLDKM